MHKLAFLIEEHSIIQYLLSSIYDLSYFSETKTEGTTLDRCKLPLTFID